MISKLLTRKPVRWLIILGPSIAIGVGAMIFFPGQVHLMTGPQIVLAGAFLGGIGLYLKISLDIHYPEVENAVQPESRVKH